MTAHSPTAAWTPPSDYVAPSHKLRGHTRRLATEALPAWLHALWEPQAYLVFGVAISPHAVDHAAAAWLLGDVFRLHQPALESAFDVGLLGTPFPTRQRVTPLLIELPWSPPQCR